MRRLAAGVLAVAVIAMVVFSRETSASTAAIGCLGYGRKPVDWWSMVKFPVVNTTRNKFAREGYGFMYLDSTGSQLEVSFTDVNDTSAPLAATLLQLYEQYDYDNNAWVLFNDQWPNGEWTLDYAHQKGLAFFDRDGGFYMVHSVPHYPEYLRNGYYGYPSYEIPNGQSFLCLSVGYDQFVPVGALLQRSGPWIYESNLPASFDGLDAFAGVLRGEYNATNGTTTATVTTRGGAAFVGLYKNKQWGLDLYEDLVAPSLGAGMLVETWMQGGEPLPSYCTPAQPWDVINVRSMGVKDSKGNDIEWSELIDHSKWGVTLAKDYTCIGGINRMFSQRTRGGGTVCHQNPVMWRAWNATIRTSDHCHN